MTTLDALVDDVGQDQTAQNVQSNILSTLSTFSFEIIIESLHHLSKEVYFYPMKN